MADPDSIPQRDSDRFWRNVRKAEGCWLWTASCTSHGYGQIMIAGRMMRAHRVAWLLTYGAIPDGLVVRHKCDNAPCCNPNHLEIGTQLDNVADMLGRERNVRGDRCGQSKLTNEQVAEIKALLASSPLRLVDIAEKFGVTKSAIAHISAGDNWGHVGDPSARTGRRRRRAS